MSIWKRARQNLENIPKQYRKSTKQRNQFLIDQYQKINPTYRNTKYEDTDTWSPVRDKEKDKLKENDEIAKELALSMVQLGITMGTKNPRLSKAAGQSINMYRNYRNTSRRTRSRNSTSYQQYQNRPGYVGKSSRKNSYNRRKY